jgi:hypothetical protein
MMIRPRWQPRLRTLLSRRSPVDPFLTYEVVATAIGLHPR